jgi:transketolase
MRDSFSRAFKRLYLSEQHHSSLMFLTGDLGFMALEDIQKTLGNAFINMGVSEQNMISVAAGLASEGIQTWTYSIASFLYARPFEQIRNDICYQNLPVVLVGNGGGYGYGSMGVTHHAMEDYGVLLTLPNMHVFTPIFDSDLEAITSQIFTLGRPTYLRLGRDEYTGVTARLPFAPWRKLLEGNSGVLCSVGSISGELLNSLESLPIAQRPSLWGISQLLTPPPAEFLDEVIAKQKLVVTEEHVPQGSFGSFLATSLFASGISCKKFIHLTAQHRLGKTMGDQKFLRHSAGLDSDRILKNFS